MNRTNNAHRTPLVQRGECSIDWCPCGHVHLTFGAITLRFDQDAFSELPELFATALARIQQLEGHFSDRPFPKSQLYRS
jgi:hypothetical protein